MAYLFKSKGSAIRRGMSSPALILVLAVLVLFGFSAARASGEFVPPPGFKSCGSYADHGLRFNLYGKHVSCRTALRVQRAYSRGAPATERGWDELCFKHLPGWCCAGGGGAVTCKKHRSVSLSVS